MNLIQYASKKERVHVEQIIREQPALKDADNVTIKTISVRKSLDLTMDVFAPAAASDEPLPVLVDIHGGGLIAGRKEQNRNFCIRMAQNGYLVFAPDYRLVPETNIFGQISDVLEALTVIEDRASEFGGDVRNLFIVADSAGAFLASMAAALTDIFLIKYRRSAWVLWRSRAGCSISTKERLVCWLTATWRKTGAKKTTPPLSSRNSTPSCCPSASSALARMTS